jgi:radical SAM-linked protein
MIVSGRPEAEGLEQLLADLESERRLEHGWLLLKQARLDHAVWGGLQARLKALVDQSRGRRMGRWQVDPERRTLRLSFEVRAPACSQHPAGLLAELGRALLSAGLPVAMGLEKSPRPAVHLGHPLPLMVEGCEEWADLDLLEPAGLPLAELPERINAHAIQGLRVLQCLQIPNYASRVAELCRRAHWLWPCPAERLDAARERMAAFIGSERYEIEKSAKVDGQKGTTRVDIRPLLEDCLWEGATLTFQTRIHKGEAANPCKLLAAILGPEPPVQGLVRTRVELGEDPRLDQAEKFEPKLHNMFEDAVLLESGGTISLVDDEDDDEPLVIMGH